MQRYRGKKFPGDGFANSIGSFGECESACWENDQCIAYSFAKAARRCSLFRETGEYHSDNAVDSGAKIQPPR